MQAMQSLTEELATTGSAEGFMPRLGSACCGARIGGAGCEQRQYTTLRTNAGHDRAIVTIDDDVDVQDIDAITHGRTPLRYLAQT